MNTVAVDCQVSVNSTFGQYAAVTDVLGDRWFIGLKGVSFDLNGRLLGKIVGYDKSKAYWVDFGTLESQAVLVKLKHCHEPHLCSPAETCGRRKNKVVYGMIKARAWNQGKLENVYIEGKELHGGKAKIFYDYDGLNVVKGRTYLDGQNILYFLPD